jgi:hypothetical protein
MINHVDDDVLTTVQRVLTSGREGAERVESRRRR